MPGADYRIYVDDAPASDEQLSAFTRIRVEQAIGMAAAAECEVALATDSQGRWIGFDDPFVRPFSRLRIEIRADAAGEFVPLLDGPVVGHRFQLRAEPDASHLVIVAHDDSVLLDREEKVVVFRNKPLAALVRGVFEETGLTARVTPSLPDTASALDRWVVQRGTGMQLLRELARRLGMFAYVEPGEEPGRSIGVFEPPQAHDDGLPELVLLGEARNIARFDAEFDALRPQAPQAAGVRTIDQQAIRAGAAAADDTPLGEEPAHALLAPALTLLAHTREEQGDVDAATAGLANLSAWAYSAQGEVDSDLYPGVLRPYRKLRVTGIGPQLSGDYLISRVLHEIGDAAYRQDFSLLRNARSAAGGGLLPDLF